MTTQTATSSGNSPQRESDKITTEQARDRLEDQLFSVLESGTNTLIEASTSLGKSYTVATTPWQDYPEITGGEPVIHFHATRNARDEAVRKSKRAEGVHYEVLEGRKDSCGVAAGEYDDQLITPDGSDPSRWFDRKCDEEKVNFSTAHAYLQRKLDGLPCGGDGTCPAFSQWERVMGADPDVIHTTVPFARHEKLVTDANLIFDERPGYEVNFESGERDKIQQATSNLLHNLSDGHITISELMTAARNGWGEALREVESLVPESPDEEWLFSKEETHRLAPKIVRAIASATEIGNERYRGRCDDVTVVFDDYGKIRLIHQQPDLQDSRCCIGLDAYPSPLRWEANLGELVQEKLLTEDEREYWRVHDRGLQVRKLGDSARSHSTGWQSETEKQKAEAIIHWLLSKYGSEFQTAICASDVEDDVKRMMKKAGIENPQLMHYGEEKSRDQFGEEPVGLLLGCIDPGDDPILDWVAFHGLDASPETKETEGGGEKRMVGRGFEGPDAESATEILESIRANHLAQSAGRYARNPDDDDSGAIVYVWSSALPEELIDDSLEVSFHGVTEKKEAFLEFLREEGKARPKEIADAVGSDKSYVIECLEDMLDQGLVTRTEGTGFQGADEYLFRSGKLRPIITIDG